MSKRRERPTSPRGADADSGSVPAAEEWSRLGAAVPRTDQMSLLDGVRTETGSLRAVPGDQTPSGDRTDGGSTEPWATGSLPVATSTIDGEPRPARAVVPDAPAESAGDAAPGSVVRSLSRLLVAVAVPLGMLAVAVRMVASPVFLWFEYHRPGFPTDPYGFDAGQRMSLGSQGVDYILNWAPPSFLGDVRTSNGVPWFRAEEISHMTDVKVVMQVGLAIAVVVVIAALITAFLRRRQDAAGMLRAAVRGAWVTIVLMVLLGVVAAVSWQWFFATFHSLFFADGTWTFSLSDTLIRLYPTRFWVDAAASVAALTLLGCILVIVAGRRALRRRHLR